MMLNYDGLEEEIKLMKKKTNMADHIFNDHFQTDVRTPILTRTPKESSSRLPRQNSENSLYWNGKPYKKIELPELKTPDEVRKEKLAQRMQNFVDTSTCHGFKYCFDVRHKMRRKVWMIIVTVSMVFLAQKLVESVTKFLDRPFSTKIIVKNVNEIEFPAISICNHNDFRNSKMMNTKLDKILKNNTGNLVELISGKEYANTTKQANHVLKDMLFSCELDREPCTHENFTSFYNEMANICFTINSHGSGTKWIVKEARKKFTMVLNIEHYDYYDATKAGMVLLIHDRKETPIRTSGLNLAPGFFTEIKMSMTKTINLKHPYSTNCGNVSLKYFSQYSVNTCWLERLTDYVVRNCSCKDGFMPGETKVCSLKELLECLWPEWEKFKKEKDIKCPIECEKNEYNPIISFSRFPPNNMVISYANHLSLRGTDQEKREFLRDNLLKVSIYFDQMSYTRMEQTPSYDLMALLGDIGGQFGLFLGSSILTYIEFFDLIIMLMYTKYFEIFKPQA